MKNQTKVINAQNSLLTFVKLCTRIHIYSNKIETYYIYIKFTTEMKHIIYIKFTRVATKKLSCMQTLTSGL